MECKAPWRSLAARLVRHRRGSCYDLHGYLAAGLYQDSCPNPYRFAATVCRAGTANRMEYEMKPFGKHAHCPTSHEILSYTEGGLRRLSRQAIAQHCALCDFCGAEAEFLTRFRPGDEDHTAAPTPVLVTVLGVELPLGRTYAMERRRAA